MSRFSFFVFKVFFDLGEFELSDLSQSIIESLTHFLEEHPESFPHFLEMALTEPDCSKISSLFRILIQFPSSFFTVEIIQSFIQLFSFLFEQEIPLSQPRYFAFTAFIEFLLQNTIFLNQEIFASIFQILIFYLSSTTLFQLHRETICSIASLCFKYPEFMSSIGINSNMIFPLWSSNDFSTIHFGAKLIKYLPSEEILSCSLNSFDYLLNSFFNESPAAQIYMYRFVSGQLDLKNPLSIYATQLILQRISNILLSDDVQQLFLKVHQALSSLAQ